MDSPSRKSTEEKQLQHSGDLGLEKPEVVFGSTKLPEAFQQHLTDTAGNVIIPDSPEALGNQQPPFNANTLKQTSEHEAPKKGIKGRVLAIGAGVVALAAGGALAIGLNLPKADDSNTPPEKDPNGSGQVVDDPEAETPAEPQTPELITSLQNTEWQGFQAAPRAEQLAYVNYGVDLNIDSHNILVEGKNRTTWTEPSRDMTGQQIVDNFNYIRDDAGFTIMVDSEGNKVLDKNEAIKKLSGAYYDTGSVIATKAFIADRDLILAQERGFITDQTQTVVSESEILQGDDQNGDPIEYKEIVLVDNFGTSYTNEYAYVEYQTVDNETTSAWLLYKQHLTE